MSRTILLASSDPRLVALVDEAISSVPDLRLEVEPDIEKACGKLGRKDVRLVVVHLDEERGIVQVREVRRAIAAARSSSATLAIGDRHDPALTLELLRMGVSDCLTRPLDLGRLAFLIDTLTLRFEGAAVAPKPASPPTPAPIVLWEEENLPPDSLAAPMGRMMAQARRVASLDSTILLGGETGTGKSRLAALIHRLSPRRDEPFLAINCGALSANLIESEMFGHVKGAFTGADVDRIGKFAQVGRGTLFLDEVDSLPPELQAKLLRAVEERVFEPVGSNKTQPMQARLIAACNRPLEAEIAAGRFRADLYYRINVFSFVMPPLRDRPLALPELVRGFIGEFAARSGQPVDDISPAALAALAAHDWPGNVRELRNVMERTVALCPGRVIGPDDLPNSFQPAAQEPREPAQFCGPSAPNTLSRARDEAEWVRIARTLERHKNNRLRAAEELGISRMTLYNKLHKYGMMAGL